MAMAATMSTASPALLQRGGIASTSSRCRANIQPTTCMFRAPRVRIYSTPNNCNARRDQNRRTQAGSCGSYGPFTWSTTGAGSYGPGSAQAWEALLRIWGVAPNSQRWQDMMRDLERGQSAFNQATGDFTSAVILPVDVEDIGDAYNFIADVPGLEKGDIKIQVNQDERQLTLSGERRRANGAGNAMEEEGSKSTSASSRRRSERRFGKFERKFKLPEDADLDAVSARVEKGVLTVMIRKSEAAANNLRDVEID